MKRREFITLLGGVAAGWPIVARAQQGSLPVIGFLRSGTAQASTDLAAAFRQGLKSAGVTEGRNVVIEYRYAENHRERLPGLVQELVRGGAAVIARREVDLDAQAADARACRVPLNDEVVRDGDRGGHLPRAG